jgi:hypothetical protein
LVLDKPAISLIMKSGLMHQTRLKIIAGDPASSDMPSLSPAITTDTPCPCLQCQPQASPINMRDVKYRGYARDDGMWDVEAELIDQKTYDIELHGRRKVPAGKPIHHMWIRLTIDADMVVPRHRGRHGRPPWATAPRPQSPCRRWWAAA